MECHAWSSLLGRYRKVSDASLNLWFVLPCVLIGGLILALKRLR